MKVKEKIKGFAEKHEKAIKVVTGVGLLAAGCVVGWKVCDKVKFRVSNAIGEDSILCKFILDVVETYPKSYTAFKVNHEPGATPAILGELGEVMLDNGVPEDYGFTHFLAIGPDCRL